MQGNLISINRRSLLISFFASHLTFFLPTRLLNASTQAEEDSAWSLTNSEWRNRLSAEAFNVLREEGTERPFSSLLNKEKRAGIYHCAGCDLPLFSSEAKFDSGTGWPSFWEPLLDSIETQVDFKLIVPRTEYHCSRCGGHQGHVFSDGPRPTGKRYCNNGVALNFRSDS